MLLLRPLTVRGVCRIGGTEVFRKSAKLRNYVWSTFSCNSHEKNTPRFGCTELISCKYSNGINEKAEVLGSADNADAECPETTEATFEEIANGDPQLLRKLKLLQFEVEVLRQTDKNVPTFIRKKDWVYLLTLNSINGRKKYLSFLFKNEKREENRLAKKKLQREKFLQLKEEGFGSDIMDYTLGNQSLFMRIYSKTINQMLPFRNELSEEIAQHIVMDCSYQEYMSVLNSKFCAVQLLYCLNVSNFHRYPSSIGLYNFNKEDYLFKVLPSYIVNVNEPTFPWSIYKESYLDHYPRDKLVYLTPHCIEPLVSLNPEDVYIIGAFVDKGSGVKASLARAKKNNLRMARLPLDEHIKWKQGTKSLPLNLVLQILLDMRFHKNWQIALQNVPRRHYDEYDFNVNYKNAQDLVV